MCSDLLAEYTNRTAAFSTDCNLCSSVPDTPASVEQQKSSLMMTSAQSRVNRASGVSERRTRRICRSAAKQVMTVAVMWDLILRSASRYTQGHEHSIIDPALNVPE